MSAAAVDTRAPTEDEESTSADRLSPRVRQRLQPRPPGDGRRGWVVVLGVTAFGAILRLLGLTHPKGLIFDEVYYAQDAHQLLRHGVEWDAEATSGSYVAHPPLGKWFIAAGEWLFGYNEFGWRFPSVVAGVVSILLVTLLARRLTGSTVLGATAGLLLSVDGMHFVLSRVALLDIFLMVMVLAAFYALVLDRDWQRARWLAALEAGQRHLTFAVPWWRITAGVLSGLAMGVKWSALWYILAFIVLIYLWEWRLRSLAGVPRAFWRTIRRETVWVFAFGMTSILAYLATWVGWFANDKAYFRHWLRDNGHDEPPVLGALYNLWHYHLDVLRFHDQLNSPHTYQSWPWQWILDTRPVTFFWTNDVACGAEKCAAEVLLLGTPLLWWCFIPALLALTWWGLVKRDWRAWAILAAAAAGIVPWLAYPDRTMFFFYALPSVPFLVLAVVFALGMIIGPREAGAERRLSGSLIAAGLVILIALCFAYFWPLFTGQAIPYDDWHGRMWLEDHWI